MLIGLYLAAIVAANLIIGELGSAASPYVAFFLIGLTLVTRDRLHQRWEGRELLVRIGSLILLGGAISFAIGGFDVGRVALASVAAFVISEALDTFVFAKARRREWFERSNISNVFGAAADSGVFVTAAFYGTLPTAVLLQIIALQFFAKVAGGLVWSWVLAPRMQPASA